MSRGIMAPLLKETFKGYWSENLQDKSKEQNFKMGLELLKSEYYEDKDFGLQLISKHAKQLDNNDID